MKSISFLDKSFTDVQSTIIGAKVQGLMCNTITIKRNENNDASLKALLEEYNKDHVGFGEFSDGVTYLFYVSNKSHYFINVIDKK